MTKPINLIIKDHDYWRLISDCRVIKDNNQEEYFPKIDAKIRPVYNEKNDSIDLEIEYFDMRFRIFTQPIEF
ncbi:MAG: hypothetical protein ACFFD7_15580 [Candidatus Thorarchaeota archaeon]